MGNTIKVITASVLLGIASGAQAVLIDFKAAAEPSGVGESAWTTLNTHDDLGSSINIDIVGSDANSEGSDYAYLDANIGGLGVCGDRLSGATADVATSSGSNLCDPPSDDNVTSGESLELTFNEAVAITRLWFNNNHDGDRSLTGNTINIGGADVIFSATAIDDTRGTSTDGDGDTDFLFVPGAGDLSFEAGESLTIAFGSVEYRAEQFYLSALEARTVPVPASLLLLGAGLVGLGIAARRRGG